MKSNCPSCGVFVCLFGRSTGTCSSCGSSVRDDMKAVYPTNKSTKLEVDIYSGIGRDELIRQLRDRTKGGLELASIVTRARDFLSSYIDNKDDIETMRLAQELAKQFNEIDPKLLELDELDHG